MPKQMILKRLTGLLVLVASSALVWGGQKKVSAPPPKPAPQAKSTPAPKSGTSNKPVTGSTNKGMNSRPATGVNTRPATGTYNRPVTGTTNRPATGMNTRPATGTYNRPVTGLTNKPATGMVNRPATGMNNRPATGTNSRLVPGAGGRMGGGPGVRSTMPARTVSNVSLRGGGTAQVSRRANGRVADIQSNGMAIHEGVHGGRTVVAERYGHTIVATGHGGYVQRTYLVRGGRTYYQRTYVSGGRTYVSVYRGWDYHGVRYYGYAPGFYYHPVFYGWAYNPWVAPVYYSPVAWGWVGAPWWGFYGGFFTPFPVYATASFWLTDYLLAANLQAAYQAQADANAAADQGAAANAPPPAEGAAEASAQSPLTPEIKQAIADEVQRQLAAERAAAAPQQAAPAPTADQVPAALDPAERVFVVSSNLDVSVPTGGQECSLTAGDVVMRLSDAPDANQNVTASVQSTKKMDCPTGQTVAIGVQDLQEMHNQFQAQLDNGLKTLADKGGTGGLPKPPDTGTTGGEVPAPAPDSSAAQQIQDTQQQANVTVAQVSQH